MSDTDTTLSHGDEYIVFYSGGPYDGQTDTRVSTDGRWDDKVTVLAALDGKETQIVYGSPVAKTVGDQVHVTYSYDAKDGEALEDIDERLSEE
jgi:hypothetical protein